MMLEALDSRGPGIIDANEAGTLPRISVAPHVAGIGGMAEIAMSPVLSMSESAEQSHSPEGQRSLSDRAGCARDAARAAADRYVRVRRQCQLTVESSHELLAMTQALRDQLQDSVATYTMVLRADRVLPERVIVLMKSAVGESDALRDQYHRALVEDVVRWAVDAYYAA